MRRYRHSKWTSRGKPTSRPAAENTKVALEGADKVSHHWTKRDLFSYQAIVKEEQRRAHKDGKSQVDQKMPVTGSPSNPGFSTLAYLGGDEIEYPSHVSIFDPLDGRKAFKPDAVRPLPPWMNQLPSNRNHKPPTLPRRLSKQVLKTSPSGLAFNAPSTSPDPPKPRKHSTTNPLISALGRNLRPRSDQVVGLLQQAPATTIPHVISGSPQLIRHVTNASPGSSMPTYPERTPISPTLSSFPFFQKPRLPLVATAESSWGSPRTHQATFSGSMQSHEYIDEYRQVPSHDLSAKTGPLICPICEESILISTPLATPQVRVKDPLQDSAHQHPHAPPAIVRSRIPSILPSGVLVAPSGGRMYHTPCIKCGSCQKYFQSSAEVGTEGIRDWVFLGSASPYHRECVVQAVKPMIARSQERMHADTGPRPSTKESLVSLYDSPMPDFKRMISKEKQKEQDARDAAHRDYGRADDPPRNRGRLRASVVSLVASTAAMSAHGNPASCPNSASASSSQSPRSTGSEASGHRAKLTSKEEDRKDKSHREEAVQESVTDHPSSSVYTTPSELPPTYVQPVRQHPFKRPQTTKVKADINLLQRSSSRLEIHDDGLKAFPKQMMRAAAPSPKQNPSSVVPAASSLGLSQVTESSPKPSSSAPCQDQSRDQESQTSVRSAADKQDDTVKRRKKQVGDLARDRSISKARNWVYGLEEAGRRDATSPLGWGRHGEIVPGGERGKESTPSEGKGIRRGREERDG